MKTPIAGWNHRAGSAETDRRRSFPSWEAGRGLIPGQTQRASQKEMTSVSLKECQGQDTNFSGSKRALLRNFPCLWKAVKSDGITTLYKEMAPALVGGVGMGAGSGGWPQRGNCPDMVRSSNLFYVHVLGKPPPRNPLTHTLRHIFSCLLYSFLTLFLGTQIMR